MQQDQFQVHRQAERHHWWFRARRDVLSGIIRQALPHAIGGTVVDVGCGTGGNVAELAEQYSVIGIDPSETAIEFAQERFPHVAFLCGDAAKALDGQASSTDLFLLSDVLEHVRDDFLMLSELFSAAKPGAYFLLTVPAKMALWSRHDESHGHYRRYDQQRFEVLWEGLPVKPLLVSHFNSRLYPIIQLIRTINRWRGKSFGEADTDLKLPPSPVNWLLEKIFAGERKRLLAVLRGKRKYGYRRGVSLIALLRREEGVIVPRNKPDDVTEDFFDPETDLVGRNKLRAVPARFDAGAGTAKTCSGLHGSEVWRLRLRQTMTAGVDHD